MTHSYDHDESLDEIERLLKKENREPNDDGTLAILFWSAFQETKPTTERLRLAMIEWLTSLVNHPTYFRNSRTRGRPTTLSRDHEIALHYLELKEQGKRHIRKFLARQWNLPKDTIDKIITTHARNLRDAFELIQEMRQIKAGDDWFRKRRAIQIERWSGAKK